MEVVKHRITWRLRTRKRRSVDKAQLFNTMYVWAEKVSKLEVVENNLLFLIELFLAALQG